MPKIKIQEIDNTGLSEKYVSNIVYIPGPSETTFKPTLCKLKSQLEATNLTPTSKSYKMAEMLLELGAYVLVEGIGDAESVTKVPEASWTALADKGMYDVRFITCGQYEDIDTNAIKCAAKRGDCIALINYPHDKDTDVATLREAIEYQITEDIDLKNAAIFAPYVTFDKTAKEVKAEDKLVPGAFAYLAAYTNSIKNNPDWFAAAGSKRGIIPGLVDVSKKYSTAECEILQGRGAAAEVDLGADGDNVGFAINPITEIKPFGTIVWGNRTLVKNAGISDGAGGQIGNLKATSFLNIRNMVSTIKKKLYEVSRKYTFEQNTDTLWLNFKAEIENLLDEIQAGNGILGYRFTKVPTNKKARLIAKLTIIPVEAVEDFDLTIELSDSLEVVE